ncbi:MAG: hypothetical protein ACFFD4_04065 [Candidatus Odinarchaeota archaeon]
METPAESSSRPTTIIYNGTFDPEDYRREMEGRRKELREMERDR